MLSKRSVYSALLPALFISFSAGCSQTQVTQITQEKVFIITDRLQPQQISSHWHKVMKPDDELLINVLKNRQPLVFFVLDSRKATARPIASYWKFASTKYPVFWVDLSDTDSRIARFLGNRFAAKRTDVAVPACYFRNTDTAVYRQGLEGCTTDFYKLVYLTNYSQGGDQ